MSISLKIAGGKYRGMELPITASPTFIGRDKDCGIRVVSDSISRRHCRIDIRGDRAELVDLKSRNGTYLNNARVAGKVELRDGDEFRVGNISFTVQVRALPAQPGPPSAQDLRTRAAISGGTSRTSAESPLNSVMIAGWLDVSERLVVTNRPVVLVIDQDASTHEAVRAALTPLASEVRTATTAAAGCSEWLETPPAVVLIDRRLWLAPGGDALSEVRRGRDVPVIMLDHFGSAETAVTARKMQVFDYALKPVNAADLLDMVRPLVDGSVTPAIEGKAGVVVDPPLVATELVGRSAAMQKVFKAIAEVAPTHATVLIHGEAGTGKDLVAKAIFDHSPRSGGKLLEAWCGVDSARKLDRELFGYEKGSFAGAKRRRIGKFEEWPGATLILHEVEALPQSTQLKLLQVLREGTFTRIGGDEAVRTTVRVLAIANGDLEKLVDSGTFREDLYFSLKSFSMRIPALREREDDIDLITDYVVAKASGELGRPPPVVSDGARRALRSYGWPGNVRQLRSVVREAVMRASDQLLASQLRFGEEEEEPVSQGSATRSGVGQAGDSTKDNDLLSWDRYVEKQIHAGRGHLYADCLGWMERRLLRRILDHTNGNRAAAADMLGFTVSGLEKKLAVYGIDPDEEG